LYSSWAKLPINLRHTIAREFNIPKRGPTEVFDNQIKFDGYLVQDIEEKLNVDAIQRYCETNELDMLLLWTWMVEKAQGKPMSKPNIDTTATELKPHHIEQIAKKVKEAKAPDFLAIPMEKPKRGRTPKAK